MSTGYIDKIFIMIIESSFYIFKKYSTYIRKLNFYINYGIQNAPPPFLDSYKLIAKSKRRPNLIFYLTQ